MTSPANIVGEDYTDLEEVDFRAVQELKSHVNLLKEYQRDMCVQRIIREYASSESDLDRIRSQYFEHLKQSSESRLPIQSKL
ncbi:hypothetical protein DPMN_178731 [Dreissena polymorpha]|uniref:Uncharacterized protein n=1 Tax=Dreissena polymorpha TaxID=45954 RepID=A0A9D4IIY4_DREPO|nr:hypothetical protein DPMN_178731 [Dreissena polymorpha]